MNWYAILKGKLDAVLGLLPAGGAADQATALAIKAKTDNLTLFQLYVQTFLDTSTSSIRVKTDNLPAIPASQTTALAAQAAAEMIEHHFHNVERWFGISADQSGNNWGTLERLTPYIVTSGNGVFGSEIKVIGSTDTPIFVGSTGMNIRRITITNTSSVNDYFVRLIFGTGTVADAEAAGQYTEQQYSRPGGAASANPLDMVFPLLAPGTKIWAKCKCVTNLATISFYVGIHEHPAPFGM
jgi:hypothetical protein